MLFTPIIKFGSKDLHMFENRNEPLASKSVFVIRVIRCTIVGLLSVIIALGIGMLGYHHYENMTWIDAFVNAAMILSDMGPVSPLTTNAGKIFAGSYAIFSGLIFIVIITIIFAPVIHRVFHKFHLDSEDSKQNIL
jgi:hypothetical protein